MGKHLLKQGLRKCYLCKNVLALNKDNFYKTKYQAGGFKSACKKCLRIHWVKSRKEHRLKGREFCPVCHQIIRISHIGR